jgi:hypothetical protein
MTACLTRFAGGARSANFANTNRKGATFVAPFLPNLQCDAERYGVFVLVFVFVVTVVFVVFVVSTLTVSILCVVSIFMPVSIVAAGAGAIAGVVVSAISDLSPLEQAAAANTAATRAKRFIADSPLKSCGPEGATLKLVVLKVLFRRVLT